MISGSIKTHEEPKKITTTYSSNDDDWHTYGGYSIQRSPPKFSEWSEILEDAVNCAKQIGFIVGARVKRLNGIGTLGTIIHIHDTFSKAWNFSTGELEPFRVQWDTANRTPGGTFDYGIQDLELVESAPVINIITKESTHENLSNLHQPC